MSKERIGSAASRNGLCAIAGAGPGAPHRRLPRSGFLIACFSGLLFASSSAAGLEVRPLTPVYGGLLPRIVNGVFTSLYPSTGALLKNGRAYCTGTMIGCQTFLTAAHCVDDDLDSSNYSVFLQHAGVFSVSNYFPHDDYRALGQGVVVADIAVVQLATAVNGIAPASIHDTAVIAPGTVGTIVGFGRSSGSAPDSGLKRAGTVTTAVCPASVPDDTCTCWNTTNPLGPPGTESGLCYSDSGGPLFLDSGTGPQLANVASGVSPASCIPDSWSYGSRVYPHRSFIEAKGGEDLDNLSCGSLPQVGTSGTSILASSAVLNSSQPQLLYSFSVPGGTTRLRVALNAVDYEVDEFPYSAMSDFNLYVRFGSYPTRETYDCARSDPSQFGVCDIANPATGTWYVLVDRVHGDGYFQLTGSLFGTTEATATPTQMPTPTSTWTPTRSPTGAPPPTLAPTATFTRTSTQLPTPTLAPTPPGQISDGYLQVWPGAIFFSNTTIGQTSPATPVSFRVLSPNPMYLHGIFAKGSAGSAFSVTGAPAFNQMYSGGTSSAFQVAFSPYTSGPLNAQVAITYQRCTQFSPPLCDATIYELDINVGGTGLLPPTATPDGPTPTPGAISFIDDFNRGDSTTIGNGWTKSFGSVSIAGNRLMAINSAGVYRGLPLDFPAHLQAQLVGCGANQDGFNHLITVRSTSSSSYGGYGIQLFQNPGNGAGTRLFRYDSGQQIDSVGVGAAQPMGGPVQLDFTIYPDGSIAGSASGTNRSANFSFGARVIESNGTNVFVRLDSQCDSPANTEGLDRISIDAAAPPSTPTPTSSPTASKTPTPTPAGSCCMAQTGPGCGDALCRNAICETSPWCCQVQWDESCTHLAGPNPDCQCATATPTPTSTPTALQISLRRVVSLRANATPSTGRGCLSAFVGGGPAAAAITVDLTFDSSRFLIENCQIHPEIGPSSALAKSLSHSVLTSGHEQITIAGGPNLIPGGKDLFVCTLRTLSSEELGDYLLGLAVSAVDGTGSPVVITGQTAAIRVISCGGDCDGSGQVSIGELQRALAHFNGRPLCDPQGPGSSCPVSDMNNGGTVSIGEIQRSLSRFNNGCPAP